MTTRCPNCDGTGWVCERHEDRPGDCTSSPRACQCGAPSMPCELCNPTTGPDDPPRLPAGFKIDVDKDGPRQ